MRIVLFLTLLALVTAGVDALPADQKGSIALEVSTRARRLRPGEVVLLTVAPSRPLAALRGEAFGRSIGFWPAGQDGRWQALVGIPLDTSVGAHAIQLHGTGPDNAEATARVGLSVTRARFATRRLQVDERFLDPPDEAADRVRREAETLQALFDRVRPGRLWSGPFTMPVPGAVTSPFGRLTLVNGTPRGRHQGTDLRAEEGTPVRAPQSGEVVLAGDLYYSGQTVVLDHGEGLYSLVAHLSRIVVAVGDRVERGAFVGESGATGRVTGPHLHWAVRLLGVAIDPLSLAAVVRVQKL